MVGYWWLFVGYWWLSLDICWLLLVMVGYRWLLVGLSVIMAVSLMLIHCLLYDCTMLLWQFH